MVLELSERNYRTDKPLQAMSVLGSLLWHGQEVRDHVRGELLEHKR